MERNVIWRAIAWEGVEHVAARFLARPELAVDSLLDAYLVGRGVPHRFWCRILTAEDGATSRLASF
jgi:hypothetical protein